MTNSEKKTENRVQWAVIAAAGESEMRVILTWTLGATLQCRGEAAGETTTSSLQFQWGFQWDGTREAWGIK